MKTDREMPYCGICDDATFVALCEQFCLHQVLRAIVFGSFARGDQSRRSDIDLLLIMNTDARYFDRYDYIYAEVAALLEPYAVDLLIYTEAEWIEISTRKFFQTIIREGVIIYESKTAAS